MKLQTCSSLDSRAKAKLRSSLWIKGVVTLKLWHLQYFVKICFFTSFLFVGCRKYAIKEVEGEWLFNREVAFIWRNMVCDVYLSILLLIHVI